MILYIASDHRGFVLKEVIKKSLKESGYSVSDLGNDVYDENDDYTDFAAKLAERVSADPISGRGILLCGTGVGVDIVANRFKGIRSGLCFSGDQALSARNDDDINVLSLPADYIDQETAKKIVAIYVQTPFSHKERYEKRLNKIREIDNTIN